jgi:hypothetical protein
MNQKDPIGTIIITIFFILLTIAGIISYKSIDWNVLKRMENTPLNMPSPIPTTNQVATPSTTTLIPATKK